MDTDSPAAERAKKRITKVTCRSDGEPCGCEDMTLADIKRASLTPREQQIVVAFGNKNSKIPMKFHPFDIHFSFQREL